MKTNQQISDEDFAAKEREIFRIFGNLAPTGSAIDESSDSEAEARVRRIMERARREFSPEGEVRIERILTRLKNEAASSE